ncbi:type II toxin-antitoxin system death-on-curing family toxin [Lactiplantibacillus mudanjiangensis]|uniref:Death-on-curing protein [Lactobacillus acidophilus] n=1 Tax=Lactiplantibacillus mudanjiangensis TaxID=1296538 RepID=A0A660E1J5_9LACO|nr:type II toxin-antitoxin system death-on-curing family toxin [Lactiplantibacillus mudanjiangensis]VDG23149.1 death-on-curing protein [Lactobacillus acidophilus] [Lactiplantibacillus mudanjiangensis]VDG29598.1 death-on-curing protein [Lactobacillus acidophilus] [Lactiplantibacillus mudanjiangensis]VDG32714.1 death-on-curing protein [Lactobacillus acidophilus] [Lactiplantibacillus mudanjiangensis]
MEYLNAEQLLAINFAVLNEHDEQSRVQNLGGLKSIEALPKQSFFDADAYPEVNQKLGIVFIKIINLHPFADGNKRTAVIALMQMAKRNGYRLTYTNQQIADIALNIAKKQDKDIEYKQVYEDIGQHLVKC